MLESVAWGLAQGSTPCSRIAEFLSLGYMELASRLENLDSMELVDYSTLILGIIELKDGVIREPGYEQGPRSDGYHGYYRTRKFLRFN